MWRPILSVVMSVSWKLEGSYHLQNIFSFLRDNLYSLLDLEIVHTFEVLHLSPAEANSARWGHEGEWSGGTGGDSLVSNGPTSPVQDCIYLGWSREEERLLEHAASVTRAEEETEQQQWWQEWDHPLLTSRTSQRNWGRRQEIPITQLGLTNTEHHNIVGHGYRLYW